MRRYVEHKMNQKLEVLESWADGEGKASRRLERRAEKLTREASSSTKSKAHKRTVERLRALYKETDSRLRLGLLERIREELTGTEATALKGLPFVQADQLDAELSRREEALIERLKAARSVAKAELGKAVLVRLVYALTRGSTRDLMSYYGQVRADGWGDTRRPYSKGDWKRLMREWKRGTRRCMPSARDVRFDKGDGLSFEVVPGCEAPREPSRLSFRWFGSSRDGYLPTQHWGGQ